MRRGFTRYYYLNNYSTITSYFSVGFIGQKYSYDPACNVTILVIEDDPFATGAFTYASLM
jgi:hypothetical protein